MSKQTKFIVFTVLIVVIVGGIGSFFAFKDSKEATKLDGFAQCLSNSGAKFYGAFWCTHCQSQKKLFGSSKQYLPYIECSATDGQTQLPICKEAGIEGYPTWVFSDGSRLSGQLPLATLAEKTSCVLPQ